MNRRKQAPMTLVHLRQEYTRAGLREADVPPNPMRQFEQWLQQAIDAGVREPNAMSLATVDASGQPTARLVLLKAVDARGFVFFTNYQSRKGRALAAHPRAALNFPWVELERQVCVTGQVRKVSPRESDAYFKLRPRGARLGAWASQQSAIVARREVLEEKLKELEAQYPDEAIPRPPHWGGYVLRPDGVEFWQGRPNRLHDRLRYTRQVNGRWCLERLSP